MLSKFDYVRPQVLEEAITYLDQHEGTKILAGGTDLMIMLRQHTLMPEHILDIKSIKILKRLEYHSKNGLFIGAAITVNEVAESKLIQEKYPALAQAAHSLASYQIRNRATLVGNICNASPGADLAGPLLVYEGQVHIARSHCIRVLNLNEFFTGVKKTVLQPQEMVIGIGLPAVGACDVSVYLKQARIKGHDLVGVAARLTEHKKLFLAMSAVAPTPVRMTQLEKMLNLQPLTVKRANWAGEAVRTFIKPISDVRSSAEYRTHIAGVLVKRALTQLLAERSEERREKARIPLHVTVNGEQVDGLIDPTMTLLHFLRKELKLFGTKEGCGEGECGACTIIMNGVAVNSCIVLAVEANGADITTVEGLGQAAKISILQQEFIQHDALQCGFCTPGMWMSARDLLDRNDDP